jgi:branched-chain amino acid transport system ATP-binding protein
VILSNILNLNGVTKHFGGLTAISDMSLTVSDGEILGLIGPNGAGKSTLFNLISGVYPASSGSITFAEQAIGGLRPSALCKLGIARTFQKIRVFKHLSVIKNVTIGSHCRTHASLFASITRPAWLKDEERKVIEKGEGLLDFVGLAHRSKDEARELSHGEQRLLEIARALATDPKLLLLDEPAAGLSTGDSVGLMKMVSKIRQRGVTVVIIEHDMEVVMGLSDRVVVLNYGKKLFEGTPQAAQKDEQVIAAYLGTGGSDA